MAIAIPTFSLFHTFNPLLLLEEEEEEEDIFCPLPRTYPLPVTVLVEEEDLMACFNNRSNVLISTP